MENLDKESKVVRRIYIIIFIVLLITEIVSYFLNPNDIIVIPELTSEQVTQWFNSLHM